MSELRDLRLPEALRSQINRIKETLDKVMKEDSTLRERLKIIIQRARHNYS